MNYEGSVALVKLAVFYTIQFINTKPLIFQLSDILPFALGWGIIIFSLLGLTVGIFRIGKSFFVKKPLNYGLIILLLSFLLFFVPNSILFAKWTRFISPTFPLFCIFAVYFIQEISDILKPSKYKKLLIGISGLVIIIPTLIWTLMFFSIYTHKDVRIVANDWVNNNIPKGALILTETGNTLEIPLTDITENIFDFYNIENNKNYKINLFNIYPLQIISSFK
jgi:hypothetical protein